MTDIRLADEVIEAVGHQVVAVVGQTFPKHELLDFVAPPNSASVMFIFDAPGADMLFVTVTDQDIKDASGFKSLRRIIAKKVRALRARPEIIVRPELVDSKGRVLN